MFLIELSRTICYHNYNVAVNYPPVRVNTQFQRQSVNALLAPLGRVD